MTQTLIMIDGTPHILIAEELFYKVAPCSDPRDWRYVPARQYPQRGDWHAEFEEAE